MEREYPKSPDEDAIIYLNKSEINKIYDPKKCIDRAEDTFKWIDQGDVEQTNPLSLYLNGEDHRLGSYPASIEPLNAAGHKWLGINRDNSKRNIPIINAVNVLNDRETTKQLSIMEGSSITAIRTGAHAAVGAKYLARENSSEVAIIGCGDEGRSHLVMLDALFDIETVYACSRTNESQNEFISEMTDELNLNIKGESDPRKAVTGVDIICMVTTGEEVVVKESWIDPGTHVAATTGFLDLDPQFSEMADKWVLGTYDRDLSWVKGDKENWIADEASLDQTFVYGELVELINDNKNGREKDNERTVMTHKGMAALDVATMD
jgi:ornithine cyclodeaminase/alanine dehydrogenase-like protein (mu-crystallin family)